MFDWRKDLKQRAIGSGLNFGVFEKSFFPEKVAFSQEEELFSDEEAQGQCSECSEGSEDLEEEPINDPQIEEDALEMVPLAKILASNLILDSEEEQEEKLAVDKFASVSASLGKLFGKAKKNIPNKTDELLELLRSPETYVAPAATLGMLKGMDERDQTGEDIFESSSRGALRGSVPGVGAFVGSKFGKNPLGKVLGSVLGYAIPDRIMKAMERGMPNRFGPTLKDILLNTEAGRPQFNSQFYNPMDFGGTY